MAELSSARVLTTQFVDGAKVTDFPRLAAMGIDRQALAERILRTYCQMVFVDGLYHADPHPGNIIAHADGSITFVDFGAVGRLAPGLKAGVPLFWDGVIRRDAEGRITAALRQMGMIARDPALGDDGVADRVISYFQKRFLEQMTVESFSLKDIQIDTRTKLEALADLKKLDVSFRNLSRAFQVPKEWVIFERTSILLLGLSTQIDPDMNPLRTVAPYLQRVRARWRERGLAESGDGGDPRHSGVGRGDPGQDEPVSRAREPRRAAAPNRRVARERAPSVRHLRVLSVLGSARGARVRARR